MARVCPAKTYQQDNGYFGTDFSKAVRHCVSVDMANMWARNPFYAAATLPDLSGTLQKRQKANRNPQYTVQSHVTSVESAPVQRFSLWKKVQSFLHPKSEVLDHSLPAQRSTFCPWQTGLQRVWGTCQQQHLLPAHTAIRTAPYSCQHTCNYTTRIRNGSTSFWQYSATLYYSTEILLQVQ